ncbi:GvpL/GvpF family gas vesicle protein [Actinacidiphila rubida]|uniref:Gas vesicle synthesis protein GvpL/GvpF n=1 Tax=Actinacidiphila rubida TaxID=310780 RepID=A0A1H8TKJ4_9ACTN|nr:GvpL/GvpF family gas vesicle protein [Actinacidiphila rubida]SEO91008.1 Gas vesicle synthesis protein GvpL/GvpF [Actinacidiphila rubida]
MPGLPRTTPGRSADQPCSDVASALWVFAVCHAGAFAELPSGAGHPEGGPVTLLRLDDLLSAVVQDVPSSRFSEEVLKQRLADPGELESCARTHHRTVTAAAEHGPVVPLPLATLFNGEARARAALCARLPHFHAALTRVRGREEWAVKVSLRQTGTASAPSAPQDAPGGQAGAGRAYLTRVRGRERERVARHEQAVAAAARVHRAASALAVESVQRRPHSPQITGKDRLQLMNAAYLVDRGRALDLATVLQRAGADAASADVEVEVSGPWVPYSFTEPVEAPDDSPERAGSRT